jgi:IMP dehydrogenase
MARINEAISRTFDEYLLLPGLTTKEHYPANVSLKVPVAKHRPDEEKPACLEIPFTSSAMQAVSGPQLAIALARKGGTSFIYCSQPIAEQAAMVKTVKEHKAGFVDSDSNISPNDPLSKAISLSKRTGHSTIAVTEDGGRHSKLLGILTDKDYWETKDDPALPVRDYFTPLERLVCARKGISLEEATEILHKEKKECLPIVDEEGNLESLVFRKDYFDHKANPLELTDEKKRLIVGAALNTHDYLERAEALMEAEVDFLCFDSSDGYSQWQKEAALELRGRYGREMILGGGNVVSAEGFRFLAEEADLDFVKVGIGGGSICITREQKGIGRGQASAVIEVAAERDRYFEETGIYVPICSDGGLNNDTNIIMALALGANFVMMGRYFAMTEESPTPKINYRGGLYKPYWGEGSSRARNWQRYKDSDWEGIGMHFEEGIDAYVPYGGPLADKVDISLAKLRSTMCNLGVLSMSEFHRSARAVRISSMTLVESGTSRVEQFDRMSTEQKK